MRPRSGSLALLLLGVSMFMTATAGAQMVQQMNLSDLADNADSIFRGEVIDMTVGSVAAGGAELPTISYRIRVIDGIKGVPGADRGYGGQVVEIRMFGSVKDRPVENGIEYLGGFRPELLDVGGEYLLFVTRPSSIGLSTMVGLGQGAFRVVLHEKQDAVVNGLDNQGLFRGIDRGDFPQSGPINYEAFVTRVRAELAN